VDGDEVGVVERPSQSRLLLEAPHQFWVTGQRFVDDLQGDLTPQPGVSRPVDLGHSTRTEDGQHLVRAQPRSGSQAHVRTLLLGQCEGAQRSRAIRALTPGTATPPAPPRTA
jgi:hypothetical protein